MNDKELLELAAKAAGIEGEYKEYASCSGIDQSGYIPCPYTSTYRGQYANTKFFDIKCWNPLSDDGDSLRLSVGLGLSVIQGSYFVAVEHIPQEGEETLCVRESLGENAGAATRRAIVRAAAEIGKDMK